MDNLKRVLMVHQGADLYGSDKSFLSSVKSVCYSSNVDVIIPNVGDISPYLEELPVKVHYQPNGVLRKKNLKNPVKLILDILKAFMFYKSTFKNYDLIYINTVVIISALFASFFYKDKKVFCHVREIPVGKQLFFFRYLLKLSGAELIFNSNATMKSFDLPGVVVHNGVEKTKLNNNLSNKLPSNVIKLLLIGRINSWKGHMLLLQALAKLESSVLSRFEVTFLGSVFEGQDHFLKEILVFVKNNKLPVLVNEFTSEVSDFYSKTDYVIVPSIKPEPFGRVAIEAFSHSKPVLCSNHGGLVEIVEDKVNGFTFRPDVDDLVKVLVHLTHFDRDAYRDMCQHAELTFSKKFTLESYTKQISEILAV